MERSKLKSNKPPLHPTHPVLRYLLDKYPDFMSQNLDSIHYKYTNTLASILNILKHDTKILTFLSVLDRPFKIWRQQTTPYEYIIWYSAQIKNIQRISIYQEGKDNEDLLLNEQNFEKGIEEYENYLQLTSNEIIPNTHFYMEVETYDGLVFQKGFPENDTPQNNIYDHDTALDLLGHLYNLPRRKYQKNINPEDYPYTCPPFCNSQSEEDYYYEKRLEEHIQNFGKVALHIQQLKNIFEITPTVKGRWRQVACMEQDTMQSSDKAKYMASTYWNNNVYDIKYELDKLPRNLQIPDSWDVYNLLENTFPIGAQVFFQINEEYPVKTEIQIKDKLILELELKDNIKINDMVKTEQRIEGAY